MEADIRPSGKRARPAARFGIAAALLLLLLPRVSVAGHGGKAPKASDRPSAASAEEILRSSRDPRELKKAAELLASSDAPRDHEVLGRYLSSAGFLGRLDTADDYRKTYAALRLTPVMETLAENRRPSADRLLLGLIASPDYQSERLRRLLLVRALSSVRPSPPEAVKYWEEKSRPGSPLASYVVESLCANQSEPALDLLARIFADPGHDADTKVFWMHDQIMPRRYDLPLLSWSERMLSGPMPKELKPALVESLFDYRPDSWFREDDPPKPPPRAGASEGSRKALERIGRYALKNVRLTRGQATAVRAGLAELGKAGR